MSSSGAVLSLLGLFILGITMLVTGLSTHMIPLALFGGLLMMMSLAPFVLPELGVSPN